MRRDFLPIDLICSDKGSSATSFILCTLARNFIDDTASSKLTSSAMAILTTVSSIFIEGVAALIAPEKINKHTVTTDNNFFILLSLRINYYF